MQDQGEQPIEMLETARAGNLENSNTLRKTAQTSAKDARYKRSTRLPPKGRARTRWHSLARHSWVGVSCRFSERRFGYSQKHAMRVILFLTGYGQPPHLRHSNDE